MKISKLRLKQFKNIVIICVLLNGTVLAGLSQQPAGNSTITVMSYNIRYNTPKDSINAWPYRKEKVAEVITSNNIDIAGLQEPWKDQILDLKKLLPEYAWFGWSRDDGKSNGEFVPVFYKKDKFTVLDKGIFWLSNTRKKLAVKVGM